MDVGLPLGVVLVVVVVNVGIMRVIEMKVKYIGGRNAGNMFEEVE